MPIRIEQGGFKPVVVKRAHQTTMLTRGEPPKVVLGCANLVRPLETRLIMLNHPKQGGFEHVVVNQTHRTHCA